MFCNVIAFAKAPPKAPKDERWVQDYGNVLDRNQEIYLLRKLKAYYDSTSTEIAIVTESSLEGDDIFQYSQRLAQTWGIGGKEFSNGVLIYVAVNDRKMFIQVGYGLEGAIPDAYAKRIIEQVLKPRFRENQYGKGFDEATTALIQMASGEYKSSKTRKEGIPIWVIILIIVILIIIFSRGGNDGRTYDYDMGRHRSIRRSRPSIWIGGGGGGWSGGGGFGGGFGGGSFGGGGAGGSW
ncbi:MAG: TPM domain-containing protein [Bacteroidia bacterium]|nr:TPM domain-containing protein [Bacteroidia bacterium]